MRGRGLLLGAMALLLAAPVGAQGTQGDTIDRASYGRVIHLYGDSINRGYALGGFAETLPPTIAMYEFRSIASMINLVFADNNLVDRAYYAGNFFSSDGITGDMAKLDQAWQSGTIRIGDVLVFEDAGPAPDPDTYEAAFWTMRAVATEHRPVLLLMMDMFDYPPAPLDSQYGTQVEGWSGTVRSRGSAVRTAALEPMPYVGQTLLLEMRSLMTQSRSSALVIDGVNLMHEDGIHPNVWGQMLMAGEILRAAGYRPSIKNVNSAKAIARTHWQTLSYGSQTFTPDRAEQYVEWLLRR